MWIFLGIFSLGYFSTSLYISTHRILRIFSLRRMIFLRRLYPARERRSQLTFFPKSSSRGVIDVALHKSFPHVLFFPLTSPARRDLLQRLLVTMRTSILKRFFFPIPRKSPSSSLRWTELARSSLFFPFLFFFCSFSFSTLRHWRNTAISRACERLKNYRPCVQLAFVIMKKRAAVDCISKYTAGRR